MKGCINVTGAQCKNDQKLNKGEIVEDTQFS
jgi:hypothetical protein